MGTGKPRWRKVFDRVERAVGAPLEDVAASNRFVEVMAVGLKARRAAGGTARRAVDGVTGKVLRAVNIPTRDDVRKLNAHIGTLVNEVRALEQQQRATGTASSRRRAAVDAPAVASREIPAPAIEPGRPDA